MGGSGQSGSFATDVDRERPDGWRRWRSPPRGAIPPPSRPLSRLLRSGLPLLPAAVSATPRHRGGRRAGSLRARRWRAIARGSRRRLPALALHHRPQRHRRPAPATRDGSRRCRWGCRGPPRSRAEPRGGGARRAEARQTCACRLAGCPDDQRRGSSSLRLADLTGGRRSAAVLGRSVGEREDRPAPRLPAPARPDGRRGRHGGGTVMTAADRDPIERFDAAANARAAASGRARMPQESTLLPGCGPPARARAGRRKREPGLATASGRS